MSLTTYQSKLVLVGGCHCSTRIPIKQLFTSTTGRQWEPSLPPMPTKRYMTTSVCTRSPEVLVTAGGWSSNHTKLHVVEVLQGDKWIVVDPLPAPAAGLHSTLHDGKLCFMEHGRDTTVFTTCSSISLISLCSKSSGNSSTDKLLWQQFQALGGGDTTVVSCSSRLVFIDGQGTVRGYSSMAQSWLMATSVGFIPTVVGYTAATVLNTGELIFAHQHGGVYRGANLGEGEH